MVFSQKITLIRHGETAQSTSRYIKFDSSDSSLSEKGVEAIKNLKTRIEGLTLSSNNIIVTSSLRRSKETANILFPDRNGFLVIPKFNEIYKGFDQHILINPNDAGLTIDDWERLYHEGTPKQKLRYKYPSGASIFDYIQITNNAFIDLLKKYPKKHIFIVAHNGTLKSILTYVRKKNYKSYFTSKTIYATYIDIEREGNRFRINKLNG